VLLSNLNKLKILILRCQISLVENCNKFIFLLKFILTKLNYLEIFKIFRHPLP
jgi:hypothetical protein